MLLAMSAVFNMKAQDWFQMHVNYSDYEWWFPVRFQHISYFDFNEDTTVVRAHLVDDESIHVPFNVETSEAWASNIMDIRLTNELEEWGKDKYQVFAIYVTTDDGGSINSKDVYKPCYISVDGMGEYPDLSMHGKIKGRGNSTWEWYDKKPYRIKFDAKTKVLGMAKNKDWVLLANYRDVTKVMNTFCSIAATWMGIPFTTPVRYAELFINGKYNGMYQVAEQVEVGGNRVDIDEAEGLLLTLDVDDGPDHSPGDNNFWTQVYNMPMQVKNPENLTDEQLDEVRREFGVLESAIKAHNYQLVDSLLDIDSYIRMIQLQEYVYNVELSAPRSIFLFRDKGGKFTLGPAWDWDAGFDFSWSDMYTGHTYFQSYSKTLLGSRPYDRNGDYRCPRFFTDMFGSGKFVRRYKELWNEISDSLYIRNWEETQKYIDGMNVMQRKLSGGYTSPFTRETERWPIRNFTVGTETNKMKRWLKNRLDYLNPIIAAYPEPEDDDDQPVIIIPDEYEVVGTIEKAYTLQFSGGYTQSVTVDVTADELATLLGVDASSLSESTLDLKPLNADGSEGSNTAAGTYGAWFDANGDTNEWGYGHVYLESDNIFTIRCGCHPDNCAGGDEHTVMMQYQHPQSAKAVNLKVTFTIEGNGGGWPGWGW